MESLGEHRKPRPEFERPSQIIEIGLACAGRVDECIERLQSRIDKLKSQQNEVQKRLSNASASAPATRDESVGKQIAEFEAEIEELRQDPARRMVNELGPMLKRIVEFVRRWEQWAAARKSSV